MPLPRPNTGLSWFAQFRDAIEAALNKVDETATAVVTASGNATATTTFANAASGVITLALPDPRAGLLRVVKKTDASGNAVTIDGNGALIDGTATKAITVQYTAYSLRADGTGWNIV